MTSKIDDLLNDLGDAARSDSNGKAPSFIWVQSRASERHRIRQLIAGACSAAFLVILGLGISKIDMPDPEQLVATSDEEQPTPATTEAMNSGGQPMNGPGWRLLASLPAAGTEFIPPLSATNLGEFDVLLQTVQLDTEATADFEKEIVVAQMAEELRSGDSACVTQVMDNVDATDGVFNFSLSSTSPPVTHECRGAHSYQLFILALERDLLPDVIRLPNRLALHEVRVRGSAERPAVPPQPASWALPQDQLVEPSTTSFVVLVTGFSCSNGSTGQVLKPAIKEDGAEVVITFLVIPEQLGDCPGNEAVPYEVELTEPLGSRLLIDGLCASTEAQGSVFCENGGQRWPPQ